MNCGGIKVRGRAWDRVRGMKACRIETPLVWFVRTSPGVPLWPNGSCTIGLRPLSIAIKEGHTLTLPSLPTTRGAVRGTTLGPDPLAPAPGAGPERESPLGRPPVPLQVPTPYL